MADCTLVLVKIFRKPSKVRKSCKGSSYITLKVLSNKTINLIFIAIYHKEFRVVRYRLKRHCCNSNGSDVAFVEIQTPDVVFEQVCLFLNK
jgi:hypothetical protein